MAIDKQAILNAGHKAVLDGNATHKDLVTPFDAHEQRVRGPHVPSGPDSPDLVNVQEFPKAVAHDDNGEPIIAKDAEHEAKLRSDLKLDKNPGEPAGDEKKEGE